MSKESLDSWKGICPVSSPAWQGERDDGQIASFMPCLDFLIRMNPKCPIVSLQLLSSLVVALSPSLPSCKWLLVTARLTTMLWCSTYSKCWVQQGHTGSGRSQRWHTGKNWNGWHFPNPFSSFHIMSTHITACSEFDIELHLESGFKVPHPPPAPAQ